MGDLSPHLPLPFRSGSDVSLPFGILKTIQMIERQLLLRTLFRALPLAVSSLSLLLSFLFRFSSAIDLGLKVPLSLRLAP